MVGIATPRLTWGMVESWYPTKMYQIQRLRTTAEPNLTLARDQLATLAQTSVIDIDQRVIGAVGVGPVFGMVKK